MFILAAAPLAYRGSIFKGMEGQKNSIKPYPELFIKIKNIKTISRPKRSLTVKENNISPVVREFLRYKQKSLLLYIIGYGH